MTSPIRTEAEFHEALATALEHFEPTLNPDETLEEIERIQREREDWVETDEEKEAALALVSAIHVTVASC